jgi:putative tryptophan/tyrosine transport system substrate-binding protein
VGDGRRIALAALCFALAAPSAAHAQSAKLPRVAYVAADCKLSERDTALYDGLRSLGYVADRTVTIERACYKSEDEMRAPLRHAVERKPDVIVVGAPAPAIAARMITGRIPIVCTSCGDPLENGLVASLARPGGNVTGFASMSVELLGKRLEIVKEMLPRASHIAILINPDNPGNRSLLEVLGNAMHGSGIEVKPIEFRSSRDFPAAFRTAARARAQVLFLQDDHFVFAGRAQLAELAIKHRLPTIAGILEAAEAGVLVAYGPNRKDLYRRAATFVDKILKGANPADLPIEQPAQFELVINLKTARALQLEIPNGLLLRADKIIE